jgi:ABC-2 type transport system permease protein
MNKTSIIIQREYLSRVKKKSFIVMTILGPILMASIWVIPIYLANISDEQKTIQVLDESGIYVSKFRNTDEFTFVPISIDIETAKKNLDISGNYALLYIPCSALSGNIPRAGILYSHRQPSLDLTAYLKDVMKKEVEREKLLENGISQDVIKSINASVFLNTIKIDSDGYEEKSFTEVSMILGIVSGILIYMFIFMYGAQVMRGVIEEKTSRIVEVIVSSVKPFQLMMGKIVGVALVGLTQFLLWIFLTLAIVSVFKIVMAEGSTLIKSETHYNEQGKILNGDKLAKFSGTMNEKDDFIIQFLEALKSVNYFVMISTFIFFFLAGYLMYAALFAAIGSAVDSEADTQQFMMPITIPLILSLVMAQFIITNPDGPVAFWLSMIPLTSPVVMMIRIPFGVPYVELFVSMAILILSFLAATWMAGKIYRTGILMYGKKVSYRELWKWLKYSQ